MFVCQTAPEATGGESPSPAVLPANTRLGIKLDVFERTFDPKIESHPAEFALACAFVAELQPADWQQWFLVFLQDKRDRMKVMELDAIEAQFPGFPREEGTAELPAVFRQRGRRLPQP